MRLCPRSCGDLVDSMSIGTILRGKTITMESRVRMTHGAERDPRHES